MKIADMNGLFNENTYLLTPMRSVKDLKDSHFNSIER